MWRRGDCRHVGMKGMLRGRGVIERTLITNIKSHLFKNHQGLVKCHLQGKYIVYLNKIKRIIFSQLRIRKILIKIVLRNNYLKLISKSTRMELRLALLTKEKLYLQNGTL